MITAICWDCDERPVLVVLVASTGEDVAEGAGAVNAIEEPGSAQADLWVLILPNLFLTVA